MAHRWFQAFIRDQSRAGLHASAIICGTPHVLLLLRSVLDPQHAPEPPCRGADVRCIEESAEPALALFGFAVVNDFTSRTVKLSSFHHAMP
ncbi:hypothetical protein ACF05T_07925 [Streptomyces lateritius]|uniref:Uncharacterized protein n=1 Tax=Streptomyces lateritius TaxID=67313 RepID=A0ABW6Y8Y1_9ACTN